MKSLPDDKKDQTPGTSNKGITSTAIQDPIATDHTIVCDLMKRTETSIETMNLPYLRYA